MIRVFGLVIITAVVVVGFLPCSEQAWQSWARIVFPVLGGLAIGTGLTMAVTPQMFTGMR